MRPLGFEPRTCGLRGRCSAVELEARGDRVVVGRRGPTLFDGEVEAGPDHAGPALIVGVAEGTRTPDFQDHNLAL